MMSKPVGMPSQLMPGSGWQLAGMVWQPTTVQAILDPPGCVLVFLGAERRLFLCLRRLGLRHAKRHHDQSDSKRSNEGESLHWRMSSEVVLDLMRESGAGRRGGPVRH
jgi:hypothetical protein